MYQGNEKNAKILVAGDFIIDHHIYEGKRYQYVEPPSIGVRVISELGGAAPIDSILNSIAPNSSFLSIRKPDSTEILTHGQRDGKDAHAFWRAFPKDNPREKQFWRVSEAMGFGCISPETKGISWLNDEKIIEDPDVIVLSEGGTGFRENRNAWEILPFRKAKHIVLKMSAPLLTGKLWEFFTHEDNKSLIKKLTVVIGADDLRQLPVRINSGRSWENTLEDMLHEFNRKGGYLGPLLKCERIIIAFGIEAGLVYEPSPRPEYKMPYRISFVYSPALAENELQQKEEGEVFGLMSCLTASVAWQLAEGHSSSIRPDMVAAVEGGISAMQNLFKEGHGKAIEPGKGFPVGRIAEIIKKGIDTNFTRIGLKSPNVCDSCLNSGCSTLDRKPEPPQSCRTFLSLAQRKTKKNEPLYDLGALVLKYGPIALERFPHLSIGKLFTADRAEVETLRSLREIMLRYKNLNAGKKPLAIGVFGPPGSGKSFSVEQLAREVLGKSDKGWLEFNLSQFNDSNDLIGAFHQIRDCVLQGLLPVAFFDEFDSQEYKWLQYLLAPMQDGKFQEGQITHALGKCIFIFAGGTSRTFESFGPPEPDDDDREAARQALEKKRQPFVLAKGPDFKSRLDAFLNVNGPNRRDKVLAPRNSKNPNGPVIKEWRFQPDEEDIQFPIRRALIIRSDLRCGKDQVLDMDEGLMRAFLEVDNFTHGARSMSKILDPFRHLNDAHLEISLLPAPSILKMHTNSTKFLDLCNYRAPEPTQARIEENSEVINEIAPAIHDTYQALQLRQGAMKENDFIDFKNLEPLKQDSNREAAKRMQEVLAVVGLELKKRGSASVFDERQVRQILEFHLDLLAMKEHVGWMDWHKQRGWQYAKETDRDNKKHKSLLPFSKLSDEDKSKDREQIRHYPKYAEQAGYEIVPIN